MQLSLERRTKCRVDGPGVQYDSSCLLTLGTQFDRSIPSGQNEWHDCYAQLPQSQKKAGGVVVRGVGARVASGALSAHRSSIITAGRGPGRLKNEQVDI